MDHPFTFSVTELDLDELKRLAETITVKSMQLKRTWFREKMLEFIASNYRVSPSDILKGLPFKGKTEYGNAKKYLRDLSKYQLIEIDKQQQQQQETRLRKKAGRQKKYYKLTPKGVYYILSHNRDLPYGVLKAILAGYNDHILYPYIKHDTLLKIVDSSVFTLLCGYINDCCRRVQGMIKSIDRTYNSKDGYLIDQLCIWNNVPKVEYDTNALHAFLIQKFKWNWLAKALITKTLDGDIVQVSHGLNSILITLDQKMKKAFLSFRGKKIYEFIIKEMPIDNQSENIQVVYADEFRIPPDKGFTKIRLVQIHLETFKIFLQSRIMDLIFSLSLTYRARLPIIGILAQDQNFIKQLNMTKQHFDRWYSFFLLT